MNLDKIDVLWFTQQTYSGMCPGVVLSKDKTIGYFVAHFGMIVATDPVPMSIARIQSHGSKLTLEQATGFFPKYAKYIKMYYKDGGTEINS